MPGGAPRNVQVFRYVKGIHLKWKVVHPTLQYGKQLHHRVVLKKLRTGDIHRVEYAVTDQSKIDYEKWIVDLTGFTQYQLNISLVNVVGQGPVTSRTFTTKEGGKNHAVI